MTQQERISEIILQLKQIRIERNLSLQDVHDLVTGSGGYISFTSVRRVFAEGSENQRFRYMDTIQPIVRGLLGVTEETPENNDISANEIDTLKNVILLKDSIIQEQQKELEELTIRCNKAEIDAEIQLQETSKEYQKKVDFLLTLVERLRKDVDDLWAENRRKSKIVDLYVELQSSLNAAKTNTSDS